METSLTRPSKDLLCELWREPAFFGNDARSRANRYIFLADDEKLTHDFARGGMSEPETNSKRNRNETTCPSPTLSREFVEDENAKAIDA